MIMPLTPSLSIATGRADPQAKLLILQVLFNYCKTAHHVLIEWLELLVEDAVQLTVEKLQRLKAQLQIQQQASTQASLSHLQLNAALEVLIQQYSELSDTSAQSPAIAEQVDLFLQSFLELLKDKVEQSTRVPQHRKENIKAILQLLQQTYPNTAALFLAILGYLHTAIDTRWLFFAGESRLKNQLLQAIFNAAAHGYQDVLSHHNDDDSHRPKPTSALPHIQVVQNMWATIESIEKQDRQERSRDQQEIVELQEQIQLQQEQLDATHAENRELKLELEALRRGKAVDEQSKSLQQLMRGSY